MEVQDGIDIQGRRGPEPLSIKQAAGLCCSWMIRGAERATGQSARGTPGKCSVKDITYLHSGIVWKLTSVLHLWRSQWFLII